MAKSPYKGRLKPLPENRKVLRDWYPGWAVLVEKFTTPSLRAKDVRRILGLTYRQIYHWHTRKLLWFKQDSQAEWRRFSIADIFGLALVRKVAELGIPFGKLQKSFAVRMGAPGHLWRALPHFVAGREGYLYTDFESFCNFAHFPADPSNKAFNLPIHLPCEHPIFILPIKPILKDLMSKLDLPDFKISANTDGSYSFAINCVPLRLEDLQYTEKDVKDFAREKKALANARRKRK